MISPLIFGSGGVMVDTKKDVEMSIPSSVPIHVLLSACAALHSTANHVADIFIDQHNDAVDNGYR
jgi:hypothetical protein